MSGAAAWTGGGSDALLRAQAEQFKLVETRNAQAKLSSKSAAQLTAQQLRISSYRMQGHGVAGNRVPDVYAQSLPPSDECDASNAALVSAAGDDALREERQAILSLPGGGVHAPTDARPSGATGGGSLAAAALRSFFDLMIEPERVVLNAAAMPGQPLYERFARHCSTSRELRLVFHGTAPKNVAPILASGLDPALRRGQAFGPGEYFASLAHLSLPYCRGGSTMLVFAAQLL